MTRVRDARPLVIGVGNSYRCDDALGILVVNELERRHPGHLRVMELPGELAGLLEVWKGEGVVAVVDAVGRANSPGQVCRVDAIHERIEAVPFHSSSHEFGLAETISLARTLECLPSSLDLYGNEGQEFDSGIGLTDPVVRSLPELIRMIEEDLRLTQTAYTHPPLVSL
jgi:hydrogenase maturation protease